MRLETNLPSVSFTSDVFRGIAILPLCLSTLVNSSPQTHAANAYVEALTKFESCDNVGTFANFLFAIKSMAASFEIWRPDEFSALLWAFPSTRRDLFPHSQYKMRDNLLIPGRFDVLLLSHNQTLFAMTVRGRHGARASLQCLVKHFGNTSTVDYPFKSGRQPVKRRILVGFGYSQLQKAWQVSGMYLNDTSDLLRAIGLTV